MEEETLTNQDEPEVIEPTASTEAQPEAPAPGENQESEGDEEAQEELEEVEVDGKVYAVPKELAPKIMMQADYTRKTQEVAELRKEAEAERAAFYQQTQVREQLFKEEAKLDQAESRLAAFRNVNWQAWQAQDPNGAQAALAEYTQLRDYTQELGGHIQGRRAELASQREQEIVTTLNKAVEALSKPDPIRGWDGKFDDGKRTKIMQFGISEGYTPEMMASLDNPLMVKHIWELIQGRELKKQQRNVSARTPAEPAARVPTSRANSPVNAKTASMDAYAAARRAGKIK